MSNPKSLFAEKVDVFLQLVDGFHPIAPDDLVYYQKALSAIQAALVDVDEPTLRVARTTGGTTYGPKGGNTTVRERLDTVFDKNGGLNDIAFATGTGQIGQLTSQTRELGFGIPFGKTLSSTRYAVLFQAVMDDVDGNGDYSVNSPSAWWVTGRLTDQVFLQGMAMSGNDFITSMTDEFRYSMLAIGEKASYA